MVILTTSRTKDNSETKGEEDGSRYIQLEVKEGYTCSQRRIHTCAILGEPTSQFVNQSQQNETCEEFSVSNEGYSRRLQHVVRYRQVPSCCTEVVKVELGWEMEKRGNTGHYVMLATTLEGNISWYPVLLVCFSISKAWI